MFGYSDLVSVLRGYGHSIANSQALDSVSDSDRIFVKVL